MGAISIWHILAVSGVVMLAFGTGRISSLLEDVGIGVRKFRRGIKDDRSWQKNSRTIEITASSS